MYFFNFKVTVFKDEQKIHQLITRLRSDRTFNTIALRSMSHQEVFPVDEVWENEAVRFAKQVELDLCKNGSGQSENSTAKDRKTEDSNNSSISVRTEAFEESEWAFEQQLHDAAGVGPEDKMWED